MEESLKLLRVFFLVLFFFTVGASFNFDYLPDVIVPASLIAALLLLSKPITFQWLLRRSGEVKHISWEVGVRLGQMSEFSLLVAYMAAENGLLTPLAAYTLEAAIIITFIVSCYFTVLRFPTPMAVTEQLRRD